MIAPVEVQRMLRLVGQTGADILQPGDLHVGSIGLSQSVFDSFFPVRVRSSRTRSSAVGVAMPLSLAMRVSISR